MHHRSGCCRALQQPGGPARGTVPAGRAGGPPGGRYISATHTDIGAESRMERPGLRHTDDP